jgi:hypothetical protein
MSESGKARPSWLERVRAKRQQRRQTATERAKRLRDGGIANSALDDLSRRNPDHRGSGG